MFTLQRINFCWFNVILGISTISFTGFGFGAGTSSAPATGMTVLLIRERSGSVVERLTRDRRAVGSSLSGVTALWSLSKTHLS